MEVKKITSLIIEPTNTCNLRCTFCFVTEGMTREGGFMEFDLFKKIIDQAENNIEFLSIASRGEPLVCKEIVPMFKYTEGKFLNLKLNTNASLLNENSCHAILSGGVKTVVFSADAADAKLYSKLKMLITRRTKLRFQQFRQFYTPNFKARLSRGGSARFKRFFETRATQKRKADIWKLK